MSDLIVTSGWYGTAWYSIEPDLVRQAVAGLRRWFARHAARLVSGDTDPDFGWKYPAF